MKYWLEAEMEKDDPNKDCSVCHELITHPEIIFVEFDLFYGTMPNPQELHPEPTGRFMCEKCSKAVLK